MQRITMKRTFSLRLCVFTLSLMLLTSTSWGQKPENPADKTLLEIELLLPAISSNPLLAQQWRKVFEEIGESVRIRQPLADDVPVVSESNRGPFRLVRVVGTINRTGMVAFPDRSFKISEPARIKEWLGELKVYGAQGSPAGKPMWGLTKDQFAKLFDQLALPVEKPLKGLPIAAAIQEIPLPEQLKVTYHSTVTEAKNVLHAVNLEEEVQGLSAGAALAFILSQQGLGFRPLRTPSGDLELNVQTLADVPDAWPVGWPLPENAPRTQFVKGLFANVDIGVPESPLSAVLDAVEEKSSVRILLDRYACLAKKLKVDEIIVSYPRKKTAWALIVSAITVNSHMTMNYRQDEAGVGFLYIVPFAHYQPKAAK